MLKQESRHYLSQCFKLKGIAKTDECSSWSKSRFEATIYAPALPDTCVSPWSHFSSILRPITPRKYKAEPAAQVPLVPRIPIPEEFRLAEPTKPTKPNSFPAVSPSSLLVARGLLAAVCSCPSTRLSTEHPTAYSVSNGIELRSKFLSKILRMASSEDITEILDAFLSVREKVIGLQFEALEKYETEIEGIDQLESVSARVNRLEVDHNLLRHLGTIKVEKSEMTNDYDEYASEFDENDEEYNLDSFESDNPKLEVLPYELSTAISAADAVTKIETPSFHEKVKIRSTLLGFMESMQEKEKELVRRMSYPCR